jgi:uncharacterized protein (DUF983 family)/rRNA-processing protein FCF1
MSAEDDLRDIFISDKVYPDARSLMSFDVPPIESVRDKCDVVVDTNVLLLPYKTGNTSLQAIRTVYERLRKEQRLFVPAQVAREFVRHRTGKIGELIQALSDRKTTAKPPNSSSYPLIAALPEYAKLKDAEQLLSAAITEYQSAISPLIDVVKGWAWRDPVSEIYHSVFSAETIQEHGWTEDDIRADLLHRTQYKLPPGYKDATNQYEGVGDLLIWLTILRLGESRKAPLLFVSGDEKPDWQYRVQGAGFLPRYELIDEYRRSSAGAPFYIARFSKFLEMFEASPEVVTEVRERERTDVPEESTECPNCQSEVRWRLEAPPGSSAQPLCGTCGLRFHLHRSSDGGVFVRRPFSSPHNRDQHNSDRLNAESERPEFDKDPSLEEYAECPTCGEKVMFRLGRETGSSAKPHCGACGAWFHAHRSRDEAVIVRLPGARHEL